MYATSEGRRHRNVKAIIDGGMTIDGRVGVCVLSKGKDKVIVLGMTNGVVNASLDAEESPIRVASLARRSSKVSVEGPNIGVVLLVLGLFQKETR